MKEEELLRNENDNNSIGGTEDEGEEDEEVDDFGLKDIALGESKMRRSLNTVTVNKRSAITGRVRVYGSVAAGDKEDSLESDLDLDGEDDASDLDSEDEIELMNLANDDKKKQDSKTGQNDSDNDF